MIGEIGGERDTGIQRCSVIVADAGKIRKEVLGCITLTAEALKIR